MTEAVKIDVLRRMGQSQTRQSSLGALSRNGEVGQPRVGNDVSPFNGLYVYIPNYGWTLVTAEGQTERRQEMDDYRNGKTGLQVMKVEKSRSYGIPQECIARRCGKFKGETESAVLMGLAEGRETATSMIGAAGRASSMQRWLAIGWVLTQGGIGRYSIGFSAFHFDISNRRAPEVRAQISEIRYYHLGKNRSPSLF